jgi:hypothetical protein
MRRRPWVQELHTSGFNWDCFTSFAWQLSKASKAEEVTY